MKLRILLATILFSAPLLVQGQGTVRFYNKGQIFIADNGATKGADADSIYFKKKQSLFVDGSAEFGGDSKVAYTGWFGLAGDFIDSSNGDLLLPASGGEGTLYFRGTGIADGVANRHRIYSALDEAGASQAVADYAVLSYKNQGATMPVLMTKQRIKTTNANKGKGLQFHNIVVAPKTYVAVDPQSSALLAGKLDVRGSGLFALEGKYSATEKTKMDIASFKATSANIENGSNDGFTVGAGRDTHVSGQVLVDLQYYERGTTAGSIGSNYRVGSEVQLIGTGVPYKRIGSDHMLYNVLTAPTKSSVAGLGPIGDDYLKRGLEAGRGYFIAMDVNDFEYALVSQLRGTKQEDRARYGYHYNRDYFLARKAKFQNGVADDVKKDEYVFNGVDTKYDQTESLGNGADVKVTLQQGLNFLANPYMQDLDLADFYTFDAAGTSDWVTDNTKLDKKFWLPYESTVTYAQTGTGGVKNVFKYKVKYHVVQQGGSTGSLTGYDDAVIAPLQMFIVNSAEDNVVITIPKSKTVGGNKPTPKAFKPIVDELLLQAVVLGDDAKTEVAEERLAIVLRDGATFSNKDANDVRKVISLETVNLGGKNVKQVSTNALRAVGDGSQDEPGGLLYTKSTEGVSLMASAIPTTAKQVPVYFTPTKTTSVVKIKPYRMESLQSVSRAWLVDKFENDKVVELTPDTEYTFTSSPLTGEMAAENRFVLYFNDAPGDDKPIIVGEDKPIICYYNTTTLYLKDLTEADRGSKVQIYDLQGRLIANTVVDAVPATQYVKPLSVGTYIVKITGERNQTTKFVVIP